VIVDVPQNELIENRILARPHAHTVDTTIRGDEALTAADRRHLATFGELGERVLKELGANLRRNRCIVDEYVKNRTKYGPTIVFATNIAHAKTLADEFQTRGIDADYVANEKRDNEAIIARYKGKRGPEVIVNVEMLTEGFDAPHTKTVFLTRPTNSLSLFTQMIGRAMRGPRSGGNTDAYLVSFRDHWRDYSPISLEAVLPEPGEAAAAATTVRVRGEPIPLEVVSQVYQVLRNASPTAEFRLERI
jgi:superfamily II DNA or RNA helicase